jgi:hypothetical protein
MPKLHEVCRKVRSKNAGPFWITMDFTFRDRESFDRHADAKAFHPATVGERLDVDAGMVKVFRLPDLLVVKVSFPRRQPQGGRVERDMHGGQQYVRLLDLEMD